jgi:DNA-binding IclR family transcriptional regulator
MHQWLRRHWQPGSFSVADLARRSGKPIATVRRAVAMQEEAGLLRRVARDGRTILYEEN